MKNFKNIICVLVCLMLLSSFSFYSVQNNNLVFASNSEYNGTIYAGDKNSNKVCIMINVYWGNEHLEKMLQILDKFNVKTTFFVGGMWAKENPVLLKRIQNAGHEIASHGYSHKEHGKFGYDLNKNEIEKCHDIVKSLLNIDMNLFAPPGGSYNANTTKSASELGYKTIMWTRDTIDWRDHNTSLIVSRAVTNMCGGDLILMHPTANSVEALSNIISYAKLHNFNPTTVSDVLGLK